jgi:hypothetical protein
VAKQRRAQTQNGRVREKPGALKPRALRWSQHRTRARAWESVHHSTPGQAPAAPPRRSRAQASRSSAAAVSRNVAARCRSASGSLPSLAAAAGAATGAKDTRALLAATAGGRRADGCGAGAAKRGALGLGVGGGLGVSSRTCVRKEIDEIRGAARVLRCPVAAFSARPKPAPPPLRAGAEPAEPAAERVGERERPREEDMSVGA